MSIQELKQLYINKNENVDNEIRGWSKSVFGVNTNGDTFWSIGVDYIYELVKLLGNKEIYDKFSIEQIENLLDNENYIQELLKTTNKSEYIKLKEILTLNDSVKKMLYDYIKNKLLQVKLEQWRKNLNNNSNVEYTELNPNSFSIDKNGRYLAKNILFNSLKVSEMQILGDINEGLKTLNNISEQYKGKDLKKICVEMLVNGDFFDWDENTITYEKCDKLLTGEIQAININDNEMEIWFNTTFADAFGGHNPVLSLYAEKERKSIGIQ